MTYSPLELAVAFIQTGELADALDAIGQHLLDQPQDDRVRRWRLKILRQLGGDSDLALADLEQLAVPTAADFVQVALLLANHDDSDTALHLLADGHARWPQDDHLTEVYLRLLRQHDHLDVALPIVQAQPTTWRWLEWEGDLLVQQGDDMTATARYGLALARLDAAFDMEAIAYLVPIRARLLLARAHAYRRLEHFDLAVDHYREAEALMPSDPLIPFNRGLVAYMQREMNKAVSLCQTALQTANPALHEQMWTTLQSDPIYADLLPKLA